MRLRWPIVFRTTHERMIREFEKNGTRRFRVWRSAEAPLITYRRR